MSGHSMGENREITQSSRTGKDRSGKARGHHPDVHDRVKSYTPIVPANAANKGSQLPAEPREERGVTNGNPGQTPAPGTQSPGKRASRGLAGVREAAQKDKKLVFTNLLHHITPSLLRSSFDHLRRDAACGVDGQTWKQYEQGLYERIKTLHDRVHRGSYRAQPSKRIYIPKPDGRQRPIGIASLEDKIVQQAVSTVLQQIYEEDFKGFSYGFRPKRKPHDALDALAVGITQRKVNWIVDADIRSFFDSLDHKWLMRMLEKRIGDPRMLRLISKWLRAGVSEKGQWSPTTVGTPQGAVISPLLANIYLHYVLDIWVDHWRQSARGDVIIARYADDFVMGFQYEAEARRFLSALKHRMETFGLQLHEEKTRLLEFGRFAASNRKKRKEGQPETFNFLGFTHICSTRLKDGKFDLKRLPMSKRVRAKLDELSKDLRKMINEPVARMGRLIRQTLTGMYQYYGVPGTSYALKQIDKAVAKMWVKLLRRRSQKAHDMPWSRFEKLLATWMPKATIRHPYPEPRFRARYQR